MPTHYALISYCSIQLVYACRSHTLYMYTMVAHMYIALNQALSLSCKINFIRRRYMYNGGSELEDFGHVLDIDDVSWIWF